MSTECVVWCSNLASLLVRFDCTTVCRFLRMLVCCLWPFSFSIHRQARDYSSGDSATHPGSSALVRGEEGGRVPLLQVTVWWELLGPHTNSALLRSLVCMCLMVRRRKLLQLQLVSNGYSEHSSPVLPQIPQLKHLEDVPISSRCT